MKSKATIIVRTHHTYTPAGTGIPFVSLDSALRWLADQQRGRIKRRKLGIKLQKEAV